MGKKLFIITGSSKGLGKALVDALIGEKDNLVIGLSRTPMEKVPHFQHVEVDLADINSLISQLGRIFPKGSFEEVVLINNAGWIGEIAPIGRLSHEGIAQIQMVNVIAPGILMNEFVKQYGKHHLKKTVVNISSGAAGKDIDGWSGYNSSKAALNRMTSIAQAESDLHDFGIKYYALSPGIIDTPMQADIRSTSSEDFSSVDKFKEFKENDELSSPDQTAEKVLYLIRNTDSFDGVLQDVREF